MVSLSVPTWQPRRRLLTIVLFVSLVANLFLGGLTLGWMLHLNLWPSQSAYVTEFGLERLSNDKTMVALSDRVLDRGYKTLCRLFEHGVLQLGLNIKTQAQQSVPHRDRDPVAWRKGIQAKRAELRLAS